MHVRGGGAGLGRFIMWEVGKKLQEGLRSGGRFFGLVVGDNFPCDKRDLSAPVSAFIELLDGLVDGLGSFGAGLDRLRAPRLGYLDPGGRPAFVIEGDTNIKEASAGGE